MQLVRFNKQKIWFPDDIPKEEIRRLLAKRENARQGRQPEPPPNPWEAPEAKYVLKALDTITQGVHIPQTDYKADISDLNKAIKTLDRPARDYTKAFKELSDHLRKLDKELPETEELLPALERISVGIQSLLKTEVVEKPLIESFTISAHEPGEAFNVELVYEDTK